MGKKNSADDSRPKQYKCQVCKCYFDDSDVYEYRGSYACADHVDQMRASRDSEREAIIREEDAKTKAFSGLDLSSETAVGKANRKIFKKQIEIASKESLRLKKYEGRED